MKCTVVLTETVNGNIHVTVPGLPDCAVEATTRDEALRKVRENLTSFIDRSEILQLDVSTGSKSRNHQFETPWDWFGRFKGEPAWGKFFDDTECQESTEKRL